MYFLVFFHTFLYAILMRFIFSDRLKYTDPSGSYNAYQVCILMYILPAFFKVAVWRAFFCIAIRRIGYFLLYRIRTCLLKNTFKAAGLFFFTIPLVFPLGNRVVKICDEHYVFNPKMINICCFTPLPGCKFQRLLHDAHHTSDTKNSIF